MVPISNEMYTPIDKRHLTCDHLSMNTATRTRMLKNRVRERRKALGWTQQTLADRAGVTRQTVNQVETIEGHQTTAVVCLRLAEALGSEMTDLFYEEETVG